MWNEDNKSNQILLTFESYFEHAKMSINILRKYWNDPDRTLIHRWLIFALVVIRWSYKMLWWIASLDRLREHLAWRRSLNVQKKAWSWLTKAKGSDFTKFSLRFVTGLQICRDCVLHSEFRNSIHCAHCTTAMRLSTVLLPRKASISLNVSVYYVALKL